MKPIHFLTICLLSLAFACGKKEDTIQQVQETKQHLPPDERFGQLFVDVQMARVFPDSKTFVDCIPKYPTDVILQKYEAQKNEPGFDLKAFVLENFEEPRQYASGYQSDTSKSAAEHINELWPILTRQPDESNTGSLIPLPNPYVVPGGRFGEVYYWDSYFTMLGLQEAGKVDMIENMVDNFAYLIDTIGFIPNGNRTYYLGRSQPPFFAMMVRILAQEKGDNIYKKYLPALQKEYNFWMDGLDQVNVENNTHRRVVRLKDGSVLNRYWDDYAKPRPESYREDVETAAKTNRPKEDVYRHLRAGAESGWDYSSRWFADGKTLETIHTTDIIPVDLNALLYNLEKTLEKAYQLNNDKENADLFAQRASQRRDAVLIYCWNPQTGYFEDYDFVVDAKTNILSLAGMYPLFFNMAEPTQAVAATKVFEQKFLRSGGAVSTLDNTSQQWDAPNGWAPLQWISIQGLRNYNQNDLADMVKRRWVDLNVRVYKNTGKMVEKYNVLDMGLEAGGGEYPVQDGFGWTNGVLLKLLSEKEGMDN